MTGQTSSSPPPLSLSLFLVVWQMLIFKDNSTTDLFFLPSDMLAMWRSSIHWTTRSNQITYYIVKTASKEKTSSIATHNIPTIVRRSNFHLKDDGTIYCTKQTFKHNHIQILSYTLTTTSPQSHPFSSSEHVWWESRLSSLFFIHPSSRAVSRSYKIHLYETPPQV